ncbi:hypothetical protein [Stutzerimonas stutzeri]|uniref:hypothetical protein n=1 Tax=Stutzerimonas stutzeri TaxID=316 RepID=UPI0021096139|nr:hypothetical protein [Stutzerimonas stutzeri]MCQ4320735.1 hypothetical protein [Stutzerimonas stutzeri]
MLDELRALRRLMYRHPPLNNQRMLVEILAQGHYDSHLRRFRGEHRRRRDTLRLALDDELPGCQPMGSPGASAFWLQAPDGVDTQRLAWAAAQQGVLFEAGAQFFFNEAPRRISCAWAFTPSTPPGSARARRFWGGCWGGCWTKPLRRGVRLDDPGPQFDLLPRKRSFP